MFASSEIRYLTKQLLIEFNKASIREKRNRNIAEEFLETLPEKHYPIQLVMPHNGLDEVRTMVIFDESGKYDFLDISTKRYETIPIASEDRFGRLFVLEEASIREDMPYNGKPYTEKVYRKVDREQAFRGNILPLYHNKCAVCANDNIKQLRAAHIKDATHGGTEEICNGICLCANHEIAFDCGDLKITSDGKIISYTEDTSITALYISFPDDESNWPSKELLKWKFEKFSRD